MENTNNESAQEQSNNSTSPILRRTNDFFDSLYDSISGYSESTVADSEYVAQQISKYEKQQSIDDTYRGKQSTIYNLHIDKVVIDRAKNDSEIENPVKTAVDQILTNFNKVPENFGLGKLRQESKRNGKVKSILSKPKYLVSISILILIIIGLSCGIPFIFIRKNKNENDEITSTSPTTTITSPTSTDPPSTSSIDDSTQSTSTTEETSDEMKIVEREAWVTQGLEISGKYKQLTPVKRIILLNTLTGFCYNEISCIEFIVDHQQNAYPEYDDVQENFLIDSSGGLIEGRGFLREGQTACETQTCYNSKAVSINFISIENSGKPNEEQLKTLCNFIHHFVASSHLDENYLLFRHSQLIASYQEYEEDEGYLSTKSCHLSLTKPPKIVKRRDWESPDIPVQSQFRARSISKSVIVGASQTQGCDSIDSCKPLLVNIQETGIEQFGDIEYNFLLANESLVFEGRGFEVALANTHESLWILYLGNIVTLESGQKLLRSIDEFLKYALEIGKLSENYKLFGEKQIKNDTESPGELLFELLKAHPHFMKDQK